ncbi:creatininase family protein [Candidatus Palauibacter soopunensis]|nr:creatininase family protein [Candidatus Palauibacter soopunensis]MDE2877429.1 creatininase family protein [Candidatus Palauibacter soopunensis]
MTSPEIGAAIEGGITTVVVAAGAIEQHGPHLPLFVDAEHGDRLAIEIARRLGRALVAPTIRVGWSAHHMAFPGTVSLEKETFLAVCRDYAVSLAHHGFRRVCFIPSHGGNFAPLAEARDSFNEAAGPDCSVDVYADLAEVIGVWREVAEAEAGFGNRVGGHADIAETSIMMTMYDGIVREELAECGRLTTPEEEPELIRRVLSEGFASVTPNGILGDARGATPELGEKMIAALADRMAAHFEA